MGSPSRFPSHEPETAGRRPDVAPSAEDASARAKLNAVASELVQTHVEPSVYKAYRYKNVSITFWFSAATLESLVYFEQAAQAHRERWPEGLSLVNIMVPGGRSMPSAEVRKKLGQIANEHKESTAAVAVMIPGSGFWASALRGLVTAVSMLAPRDYKLETCSSLREVAERLTPLHRAGTGVAIEAAELLRVLQEAEAVALRSVGSLQPPARS